MIAFLLLLVKTVGRETTLNRPVDSIAWTIVYRVISCSDIDISTAPKFCRMLAKIN